MSVYEPNFELKTIKFAEKQIPSAPIIYLKRQIFGRKLFYD